jgi:hypothetical protein
MKIKILFLMIAVFVGRLSAQTDTASTYFAYAQILGSQKILSNKVNVIIDYGQDRKWFSNHTMVDKDGKTIDFASMVDAMNYMGEQGWEFVQAYVVTVPSGLGGGQNVYHWLMKRACVKGKDGAFIPLTRNEYQKSKEMQRGKTPKTRHTTSYCACYYSDSSRFWLLH